MEEIWKDVLGYEGVYRVSNKGNVFSVKRKILMKPFFNNKYYQIKLSDNGNKRSPTVHRLVMEAFVGESHLQIDHKDGNKLNNFLENLEYVDARENVRRHHQGKRTEPIGVYATPGGKFLAVYNLKKETYFLGTFSTVNDAIQARKECAAKLLNFFTGKQA